ncbi:glyoxylate/succinic semialdehyde reductase 2, chloroplastic isoform X1 [Arachis hypogaea]|uniref:glyoxylate/succinic semialdehyde reductase 2, chloroplastic isoform X1 n=1 Tax=Arachis hypogaea TaxID=3818 RepID=UPI003B219CF5
MTMRCLMNCFFGVPTNAMAATRSSSLWGIPFTLNFNNNNNHFSSNSRSLSYISNSTSSPAPRVGFLGIGIMGSPMAHNLLKAGVDLTLWNRTKSKCDPLISLGAKYLSSPEEVAASCDLTFAMLADPHSAIEVACGNHGAANGMALGKGYVDVSTVDVDTSKLISERIKATGALFLEVHSHFPLSNTKCCVIRIHITSQAPVSGSKKPAEDGQLIFLTAGDRNLYETVAPLLDIMGKSKFYLGDVGNGAAMKLVVNMIMGSMMASFSEGLLLSEKVGLDPKVLVEVVSQGAISAPMYSTKGPSMIQSLYPTAFPLKHQQKDLRLALGLAESVSQSTPIAAAANELYKVAKSHGLSDEDFSAVIEALKSKFQQS